MQALRCIAAGSLALLIEGPVPGIPRRFCVNFPVYVLQVHNVDLAHASKLRVFEVIVKQDRTSRSVETEFGTLQVVLKVAERCNINCTYCYYFNGGDESALTRPPIISRATLDAIADYLAQGVRDLGIPQLSISFHGGEPLMMKPTHFDYACKVIRSKVGEAANVAFLVQTNGTVWTPEFAKVFKRHEVNVGISLDGGQIANDRFRLDHNGKSTFDRIVRKLSEMNDDGFGPSGKGVSCIAVLDSRNDYADTYRDLRSLGFKSLSFLFPDRSQNAAFSDGDSAQKYGQELSKVARAYFSEDDERIYVRQVNQVLNFFQRHHPIPAQLENRGQKRNYVEFEIMVIHSDGTISLNDSYMPALEWWKESPKLHVSTSTVRQFVDQEIIGVLNRELAKLPKDCQWCKWRGICRGGEAENRFSLESGFANSSVYCEGLKEFYETMVQCLVENGYPRSEAQNVIEAAAERVDQVALNFKEQRA